VRLRRVLAHAGAFIAGVAAAVVCIALVMWTWTMDWRNTLHHS
jgi:hypothetical protein